MGLSFKVQIILWQILRGWLLSLQGTGFTSCSWPRWLSIRDHWQPSCLLGAWRSQESSSGWGGGWVWFMASDTVSANGLLWVNRGNAKRKGQNEYGLQEGFCSMCLKRALSFPPPPFKVVLLKTCNIDFTVLIILSVQYLSVLDVSPLYSKSRELFLPETYTIC